MDTIGPTTNHSTGRADHPLAFEVTSAERSRLGRPSSFLNEKERKQALNLQLCSPSEAASEMPPYLNFQLQNNSPTFARSYILTSRIPFRSASAPRPASGLRVLCGLSVSNSGVIAASEMPPLPKLPTTNNSKFEIRNSQTSVTLFLNMLLRSVGSALLPAQ